MKTFLPVIFTLLLFFVFTIAEAQNDKTATLKVGDTIPDVTYKTIDDLDFNLDKDLAGQKLVIIFYRASWCPYCNEHLSDMQGVEKALIKLGYKVIAISTESTTNLQVTKDKTYVKYMLLSDETKQGINRYGIVNGSVAVPSVFIVDKDHVIRYIYTNTDYKIRLSSQEVLDAAQKVE